MATKYPVQSLPDGRVRWSDGSISGGMSTSYGQVSTQSLGPLKTTYQAPQVLGTGTSAPSQPQSQPQPQQQPSGPDPFDEMRRQAEEQARLDLEDAMRAYDRYAEEAEAQKVSLGKEKENVLSTYDLERERATKEATTAKTEAEESVVSAKGKALSTAEDVQRKNRNVLRALGILSSSAAGEMLAKPMTEYGTQAGELEVQLIKRRDQVDDWLMDRNKDIDLAVRQVNDKFTDLIGQINRDIRYSGEERASAVRQATAAKQQVLSDIRAQSLAYQQAAQQYNANLLAQIAQIELYQNPQADVTGILSSLINYQQPSYGGGQATQLLTEEQKRKYGLLSG